MSSGASSHNRLLGRTGRRIHAPRSYPAQVGNSRRTINRIARGGRGSSKAAQKALTSRRGGSGIRLTESPQAYNSAFANTFEGHVQNYNKRVAEEQQIMAAMEADTARETEDKPWYQDVWQAIGGGGSNPIMDNFNYQTGAPTLLAGDTFSDSIIGRGLNLISRIPSAGFNALESAAGQNRTESGGPDSLSYVFETLKDAGAAAGRGITGEELSGGGEWYEALKENRTSDMGAILRNFEATHPTAEQNVARGVGLGTELFGDLTNFVAPALPPVIAKGDLAGKVATPDTLQEALRLGVTDAATNVLNVNSPSLSRLNANDVIDMLNNHVVDWWSQANLNVSRGGSSGLKNMTNPVFSQMLADTSSQRIIEMVMEDTHKHVDDFWLGANTGTIDAATVNGMMTADPDFGEFVNGLVTRTGSKDVDELLNTMSSGNTVKRTHLNEVLKQVTEKHHIELEATRNAIIRDTSNMTYREAGIRIGRQRVAAPFRPVGRAYAFSRSKLDDVMPNAMADLSQKTWEQTFPGMFGLKTGRARALAFKDMAAMEKELAQLASKFTKEEGELLQRALLDPNHVPFSGHNAQELNDMYDNLRGRLRKMFEDEVAAGARPARGHGSAYDPNYAYIHVKGGTKDARTLWKDGRKAAINGKPGPYNNLDDAISQGLKPETDAFASLYQRYVKSRRDTARAYFHNDLVETYGLGTNGRTSHISDKVAKARGLKRVEYNKLSESLRLQVDQQGGDFFLPGGVANIEDQFRKISGWSTANWDTWARRYAGVINKLKTIMTLPFTGFQMRNFMGDVFMGLLDNINPKAYEYFARKWALHKAGRAPLIEIYPGYKMPFSEAVTMYNSHANGGFFNVEFGTYSSLTAGSIPKRMGRRSVKALRTASEIRESMGRFVHFMEAYRQEARALVKKGVKNHDIIMKQASDAALWRVNFYKFDYNALMPFEKKMKTLAFPFYTYMRKAVPTLLMQMYTNPHYFGMVDRFRRDTSGTAAEAFNSMNIPQWIKDIGFMVLDDAASPLVMTQDALPIGRTGPTFQH